MSCVSFILFSQTHKRAWLWWKSAKATYRCKNRKQRSYLGGMKANSTFQKNVRKWRTKSIMLSGSVFPSPSSSPWITIALMWKLKWCLKDKTTLEHSHYTEINLKIVVVKEKCLDWNIQHLLFKLCSPTFGQTLFIFCCHNVGNSLHNVINI